MGAYMMVSENKNNDYKKEFLNRFKRLCSGSKSQFEVWQDLIDLFSITIANSTILPYSKHSPFKGVWEEREEKYLRTIQKYNKIEQSTFPEMFALLVFEYNENSFQDLLGSLYMQLEFNNKNKGQFFTPFNICRLMSEITINDNIKSDIDKKGYVSVNDCACGAGATLIAAAERVSRILEKSNLNWQNHVYFVSQDIDEITAKMCYIQLSIIGCPGYVTIGNTLSEPVVTDLKRIYFTPMWFSNVWTQRRFFHGADLLMCFPHKRSQNVTNETAKAIDMRKDLEKMINNIKAKR